MTLNISPGPWTYQLDDYIGQQTATVYGADGDGVALIRGNLGYDVLPEDNARLIAAAPDMLEALIDQARHYNGDESFARFAAIKPVIEKATGKTWEELTK